MSTTMDTTLPASPPPSMHEIIFVTLAIATVFLALWTAIFLHQRSARLRIRSLDNEVFDLRVALNATKKSRAASKLSAGDNKADDDDDDNDTVDNLPLPPRHTDTLPARFPSPEDLERGGRRRSPAASFDDDAPAVVPPSRFQKVTLAGSVAMLRARNRMRNLFPARRRKSDVELSAAVREDADWSVEEGSARRASQLLGWVQDHQYNGPQRGVQLYDKPVPHLDENPVPHLDGDGEIGRPGKGLAEARAGNGSPARTAPKLVVPARTAPKLVMPDWQQQTAARRAEDDDEEVSPRTTQRCGFDEVDIGSVIVGVEPAPPPEPAPPAQAARGRSRIPRFTTATASARPGPAPTRPPTATPAPRPPTATTRVGLPRSNLPRAATGRRAGGAGPARAAIPPRVSSRPAVTVPGPMASTQPPGPVPDPDYNVAAESRISKVEKGKPVTATTTDPVSSVATTTTDPVDEEPVSPVSDDEDATTGPVDERPVSPVSDDEEVDALGIRGNAPGPRPPVDDGEDSGVEGMPGVPEMAAELREMGRKGDKSE
ncbi:hypothetical protein QBC39DRAFT_330387 [Podospora conica]|nr:hypothetical protein QBC39DRAFT_330387 [Schizothecium conicum]